MNRLIDFLRGKKTHIGMIGLGIVGLAASAKWIDATAAGILASLIGTWTGVSARAAIRRVEKKVDQVSLADPRG